MSFSLNRTRLLLAAVLVSLFAVFFALAPSVNAVNPTTMSFQGKVVNANGTNVTDGTYGFVFKLYTVSSGGSAIWTETDAAVTVTSGVFQVNLGAGCPFFTANACNGSTPIDFNASPALYLGITFNADPAGEMTPRVQLQSVPYAFNADKVGGLSVTQLVQLSPAVQQTGFIDVGGNISSAATIQGATIDGTTGINTGAAGGTQRIDNAGNLLNIGNITATGALAIAAGGAAQNVTVNASTTGKIQIGTTSTGDVELGGGSGSSGCTLTNSNGNLACSGSLTTGSSTTVGSAVFNDGAGRTVTVNTPTLAGSYNLSLPSTGPAVSQCLQSDSVTASQLVFASCAAIGQKLTQTFNTYAINQAANATTAMNYLLPTGAAAFSIAVTGTTEFKAAAAGSFRACSLVNSANVTAGTVGIRFRKNGANTSATSYCTLSTANARTNSEQVASGVETFAAGDTIGIALVSTGLTPATSDHWASFTIEYGAGGVGPTTLQDAYDNGNSVTTNDASDLLFNLANTATDSDFLINIATGSTGVFAVQNNGTNTFSINAAGAITAVTGVTSTGGYTQTGTSANAFTGPTSVTNNLTVNTNTGFQTLITSNANVPTLDQVSITNTGSTGVTTAGVNGLSVAYRGGAAAIEAAAARFDLQPGTTSGGIWSALRVVPNATGAVTGVTENGLKIDNLTTPGAGTENALFVGTGWDNVFNSTNFKVTQTGSVTVTQAGAADTFRVQAGVAPTTDMFTVTNVGFANVTAGVNAQQIDYYSALTTAASEAASVRLNITNTSTVATTSTDGLRLVVTSSAATGITNGLKIDAITAGTGTENALNVGSGWDNIINSPNFILAGTGQVFGKGFDYFDPTLLTQATGLTGLGSGGATGGNFGGVFSSGAFIGNNSSYGQEFVGSVAAATTNNANAGDDGLWYFNNNAQASITGGDTSTTGGFYEFAAPATTTRAALLTQGATPGTQDKPLAAANLPIVQMKVKISVTRITDDLMFGMMDTATASATNDFLPANGIVFWSNNSTGATSWQGVIRSGSTSRATVTCPATEPVTAGQYAVGRIVVMNTTTVRFFIDSDASDGINLVDCGTATTTAANMPAVAMAMGMHLAHTVAATATADLDYARFWQDDSPVSAAQAQATSDGEQMQADIATATDTAADTDPSASENGLVSEPIDSVSASSPTDGELSATATTDGTTQLTDSTGQPKLTFDVVGDASLPGNLSLAGATLSGGLIVNGDATFSGLSTFQKLATFLGKTVFRQDVEIDGHLTVSADSAGYAKLRTGESTVHVTFKTAYDTPPIVSTASSDGQFVVSGVNNVTPQGFDISLQNPAVNDITFSWTAVGVINPQTAANPPPAAATTASD